MKFLIKKTLKTAFTLIMCLCAVFLVWLVFLDGKEKIGEMNSSVPDEPQYSCEGFYYESLDDTEKIAYELIVSQITTMPKKIQIPSLDDEGLSDVFEALLYDNPTYFFLSDNCRTETNSFGNCYFIPEYEMNLYRYDTGMAELEKIRDFVQEKTANLSDEYEKELFIHDYIVNKCKYVDKTGGEYSSAYGCLVNGEASCEGYAKAVKYLLDAEGIENYLAVGTTKGETPSEAVGHAWNIAKINGKYYHLDATWDNTDDEKDGFISYSYFNVTDSDISLTHKVEKRFLGRCTSADENYFVKNQLYFDTLDASAKSSLASEIAKQARLENAVTSFRMAGKDAFESTMNSLFEMNEVYGVLLSASIISDRDLKLDKVYYVTDDKHFIITLRDFIA